MKLRFVVLLLFGLWFSPAQAQVKLLQSGPMVGYSDMKEVMLWAQTNAGADVYIEYWDQQKPGEKFKTNVVKTQKEDGFTAKLIADKVEPGRKYSYELFINKKKAERPYPLQFQTQELWQYRKDAPDFRFALGSCNFVNDAPYDRPNPYGGGYEIFESIYKQKPEFMLWLGDNTYLREPDWNTWTGILNRYTHTRSLPQLQPLLGSSHHYAIWDDHDFGPNDSDRSFWNKDQTLKAFKLFWANPNYVKPEGVTGTFTWNDVQFFLLDDRFFKTPNKGIGKRELLGEEQIQWLIDALTYSNATFKFIAIGGQVLNTAKVYENYSTYEEERNQLLSKIREANIPGVIFLDGDRHHTELTRLDRPGTYPLYDLTVSPLTAGPAGERARTEANTLRVPDTYVGERNFAMMEVTGSKKERQLKIVIYNGAGNELWNRTIKAAELMPEKK